MNTKPNKWMAAGAVAVTIGMAPLASAATVLFNDTTFSANPNAEGYYSATSTTSTVTGSGSGLTWNSATNFDSFFKQFTPTTLAVGETMTLSFTLVSGPAGNVNTGFYYGLYDTSNTFASNQVASPWTGSTRGYALGLPRGTRTATAWYGLNVDASNLLSNGSQLGSVSPTQTYVAAGPQTTLVEFSITRSGASTILLDGTYDATTMTTFDTGANDYFTFDTFAMGMTGGTGGFIIDNISVTVVPEPSSIALLAVGLFGAMGMRHYRMRRARTLAN